MVIKIILKINNLWPELFNFQNSFYLFETLSHINITATTYIINIHVRQKCHQHQTRALKCFAKGHSHRKKLSGCSEARTLGLQITYRPCRQTIRLPVL